MTIHRLIKLSAVVVTACAVLVGCAAKPVLAPAGALTIKSAYSVRLDRNWSDVTPMYYSGKAPKVKVLTIDGLMLNRLHVSDGLTSADPLIIDPAKPDNKTTPALRGKADMSLSEQMEFVAQSVGGLDLSRVTTTAPKPVTLGDSKGVRFELTAVTKDGLNMRGLAQAVSKGGLSYYIVYLAPAEHYYAATLPNAVAVMDSGKLP